MNLRPVNRHLKDQLRPLSVAISLSLIAFALLLSSSWNDSPSYDEPEHVASGVTCLGFGIFYINPVHPPLVKDLAGLSVTGFLPQVPLADTWWTGAPGLVIDELFSGKNVDVQKLIRVARAPIILLSSCFIGLFYLTLHQSYGPRVALLASALLLLSPTFLAHGAIVHTDVGAAALCFLTLWFTITYLKAPPSVGRALALGLVGGTAAVIKFSCLLLIPLFLVIISCRPDRWARWRQVPIILAVGLSIIWLMYKFHPIGSPLHQRYLSYHFPGIETTSAWSLTKAGEDLEVSPFAWYATGVLVQGRHFAGGHDTPTYLNGKVYFGGDWTYFPIVLLAKLPTGTLLLAGLSLVHIRKIYDFDTKVFLGFTVSYLAMAALGGINLGIRHIFPVFPFIFVSIARSLDRGLEFARSGSFGTAVRVGFAILLLGTLSAWPNYLRYFNISTSGEVPVVDSNYDWGTDLYRLSLRARAQDWSPIHVMYFGRLRPESYLGPHSRSLPAGERPTSGWVAVSHSILIPIIDGDHSALPAEVKNHYASVRDWLESLEEVETIGTFTVFRAR